MTFKALLATKTGKTISTSVVDVNEHDLMPGDVTIAVDYSTVNYKDALAVTGRSEAIRQFPLIAGIDLAGTVEASTHPGIAVGDRVVANGWGLSQTHHGGYAQKARMRRRRRQCIAARAIVPPDATCSTPPVVIPPEKQS